MFTKPPYLACLSILYVHQTPCLPIVFVHQTSLFLLCLPILFLTIPTCFKIILLTKTYLITNSSCSLNALLTNSSSLPNILTSFDFSKHLSHIFVQQTTYWPKTCSSVHLPLLEPCWVSKYSKVLNYVHRSSNLTLTKTFSLQ